VDFLGQAWQSHYLAGLLCKGLVEGDLANLQSRGLAEQWPCCPKEQGPDRPVELGLGEVEIWRAIGGGPGRPAWRGQKLWRSGMPKELGPGGPEERGPAEQRSGGLAEQRLGLLGGGLVEQRSCRPMELGPSRA
jgi:hypothetical protein